MFTWLRKVFTGSRLPKGEAKSLAAGSIKITTAFAELVETYPIEFVDASLLPAPKEAVRFAFKVVWSICDQQMREVTEAVYLNLHRFQDGVGVVPISPELPATADPATTHRILTPFLDWARKTKAEADELFAEVQDWKRNGPAPTR